MTPAEWKQLKHFSAFENWGEADRMQLRLVKALDIFRDVAGTPILVTCGTQGKHSEHSEHYQGGAVDILFPNIFLPGLLDLFLLATRFDEFDGIGIYPHWRLNGVAHGGLHLDVREVKSKAYWMGVPGAGGQRYVSLNAEHLRKYGLV